MLRVNDSLYETVAAQYRKVGRRHMFTELEVDREVLEAQTFFPRPPAWLSQAAIQQQWKELSFPSRQLKKKTTDADLAQFHAQRRLFLDAAAAAEREAPTRFKLDTAWPALVADDERHYLRDRPAAPKHTADQIID